MFVRRLPESAVFRRGDGDTYFVLPIIWQVGEGLNVLVMINGEKSDFVFIVQK